MTGQVFATKGNLLSSKKTLSFSKMGYDLMDRKRNILIREMMLLIDRAKSLQQEIDVTFKEAYRALQTANMSLGIIEDIAAAIPVEEGVEITFRSVMGVEIPVVSLAEEKVRMYYSMAGTNSQLDFAYISFLKVKRLSVILAEVENSVYRLANAIRKTQRRANALKNIIIPNLTDTVAFITDALEEKEREEFSRMKVIKTSTSRKGKTET